MKCKNFTEKVDKSGRICYYIIIKRKAQKGAKHDKDTDFQDNQGGKCLADELKKYEVGSKEYNEISQAIGWTLDSLVSGKGYALHYSERTGHYWVKFF